jgi:phosphatidate cytidylyltransferase
MLKQRIITAIILFVLFLAAVFTLPEMGWTVLIAVIFCLAATEWARLSKMTTNGVILYSAVTIILMLATLWLDNRMATGMVTEAVPVPHLLWYGASVLMWVLIVPAWMILGWHPRNLWTMGVVGLVVLIPTGLAIIDLHSVNPSPWWMLFAMSVVWLADTAAYFSGRKFGKHKLAPAISPGKTWEGVLGALLFVTIYVSVIGVSTNLIKGISMFVGMLIVSWIWVALSVMGDLFESAIKRQAGVKDSGTLLPGHGGLLDRIDALTSTLPFVALVIILQKLV